MFASLFPNWKTSIYIKVTYHKLFKNAIKSFHPKDEENGEQEVEQEEGELMEDQGQIEEQQQIGQNQIIQEGAIDNNINEGDENIQEEIID